MLVVEIIIDHAPDRGVSRARGVGYDFNGVLPVKDIVNAIPSADLDWVDLIKIEVGNCPSNMRLGQVPLIILVRYKVLYRYLLKLDIWNK